MQPPPQLKCRTFLYPPKFPCAPTQSCPLLIPSPSQTLICFQEFHIKGIIQYVCFCVWLILLNIPLQFSILLCIWIVLFNCWLVFHFMSIPHLSFHLLMDIWLFSVFGYYEQSCYKQLCTSLWLDKCFHFFLG